tara:strand:- start:206585 stop:207052 length:468 start_codon:yes stop_codon:yes gene_type:complete
MNFVFLADRPEALELVSRWYYDEWGRLNPETTIEGLTQKLSLSMNRDKVPLILLAIDQNVVVGAVELKYREMKIYPDKEHWLGGLYVTREYRGSGIGKQLVQQAVQLAHELGISQLHLQTEQLDGGIYTSLGWRPTEQINNKGVDVLVMEKDVGV